MYHLEQEAFLRAWIQVQDQDIFVVGEDLAWVDLVQENWIHRWIGEDFTEKIIT